MGGKDTPSLTSHVKVVSLELKILQLYLGGITDSRGKGYPLADILREGDIS